MTPAGAQSPRTRAARWREVGQAIVLLVVLSACTAVLLWVLNKHYPLRHWLFPRYATYFLCSGLWLASCLSAGYVALRWVLGRSLPLIEHLAVGFGLGVVLFQLLMFGFGMARLYGPALFVLLPLVMLAVGLLPLVRDLSAARRKLRAVGGPGVRITVPALLAFAFGTLCLVALYLPTMMPNNISYDAQWRHLAIAEQYVVHGGIRRYDEGWIFAGGPQFPSLIYTWGFLLPGSTLFDRVELCAHLEFVVFCWTTLVGITAIARRLVPGANPLVLWVARFTFPGIFLYDSSLSAGTDHLSAVLAPPLLLLGLRAFRGIEPRLGLLLGLFMGAAVCTKETAALLFVPAPALTVALRFALDLLAPLRGRPLRTSALLGAVTAGVCTIVVSAAHWLKNIVWYGDPLYPNLYRYFSGHPWHQDAAYALKWGFLNTLYVPSQSGDVLTRVLTTLVNFSFVPNDWWVMHRDVPVFGSLFTLLIAPLPFLRGTRRIWFLVCWVHIAILVWYFGNPYERHLQTIVPWMAASVAATCVLLWRTRSIVVRTATVLLVATQLVWGADIYFFPGARTPAKMLTDFFEQSYQGKHKDRLAIKTDAVAVTKKLPRNAVLLLHDERLTLGFARKTVTDFYPEQYAINYPRLTTPDRVYATLRRLGVTHLTFTASAEGYIPLGGDIAFYEFAWLFAENRQHVSGRWLAAMPKKPPPPQPTRRVAVLGCNDEYENGIYELADLNVPRFGPAEHRYPRPRETAIDQKHLDRTVFAIAFDPACKVHLSGKVRARFDRVATRSPLWGRAHEIWLRMPR
jgi:hypothetical protein